MNERSYILLCDRMAPVWSSQQKWIDHPVSLISMRLATVVNLDPSAVQALESFVHQQWQLQKTAVFLPLPRQIRALFFDFDATVVEEETIVELARHVGVSDQVELITRRAMLGELDFSAALRERVQLLRGLPAETLLKVQNKLHISKGLPSFCRRLLKADRRGYIVSGGFDVIVEDIAESLGFSGFLANHLEISNQSLTGRVVGNIIDGQAKASYVRQHAQSHGLSPDQIVCIGDGANDIPMMQVAGVRFGHHPKPPLLPHLDGAIFNGDFDLLADVLLVSPT